MVALPISIDDSKRVAANLGGDGLEQEHRLPKTMASIIPISLLDREGRGGEDKGTSGSQGITFGRIVSVYMRKMCLGRMGDGWGVLTSWL